MRARLSPYCWAGPDDAGAVGAGWAEVSVVWALAPAASPTTRNADETTGIVRMCHQTLQGRVWLSGRLSFIPAGAPPRLTNSGEEQRRADTRDDPERAGAGEHELDRAPP